MGMVFLLSACRAMGSAAPVVKIGLIAPFEGLGRPLGYAILPVIQEVVGEANTRPELRGYRLSLVALNDDSYGPEAAAQARLLALDPEIVAVLGPWIGSTLEAAAPVLTEGRLATVGAAPAERLAGIANVCPTASEVAGALLVKAREANRDVVIAGPENALAYALSEMEPGATRWSSGADSAETLDASAIVIHTGDAEGAANDLVRWRASGWHGPFIGGPDMAQPWFGNLAGAYAEGAAALVCGRPAGSADPANTSAMHQQAASEAAEAAIGAIASAIAETGRPSRSAVAQELAQSPPEAEIHWYRYSAGRWLHDADASASPDLSTVAD